VRDVKDNEKLTVWPGLEADWDKAVAANQDSYGHGVIEATCLIGAALDAGKSPEEAEKACRGLGITGFMAGCMAEWVAKFHPRGPEFRRWWNIHHQIGTEGEEANRAGGVINPAIMNLKC
jgi:hypothetical protein